MTDLDYKIKTKIVTLNAFSIPGYNLPTFQRATMKYINTIFGDSKQKILMFSHFEGDMEDVAKITKSIIRIS